jgi:hypothetical protein
MIKKLIGKFFSIPVKDTIKVYRGEYLPGKNPYKSKNKKGEDFEYLRDREDMIERELTPESLADKINMAEGRYFTTNKDIAKIFSKGEKGRVVEAEILKKDLKLGKKIRDRFFKFSNITDDNTLLLPKKNGHGCVSTLTDYLKPQGGDNFEQSIGFEVEAC